MAKRSLTRKPRTPKTAPKQSAAIVPVRAELPAEQPNTLPTSQELPLAFLSSASKLSLQEFWLKRLASAEGWQRKAADAIRDAVDKLAASKLAQSGIYVGEFVQECRQLASAESFQRAAADALSAAVDELAAAKLARLAVDGVLERTEMPRNDEVWEQRQMLRIHAKAILAQENSDLEPFFRPKPLSAAIMRECTLDHRRVTKRVYIYQGCLRCQRKGREYGAAGFCKSCLATIRKWRGEVAAHPEVYEVD